MVLPIWKSALGEQTCYADDLSSIFVLNLERTHFVAPNDISAVLAISPR
jgi:hypothetical protein